METGPTSGRLSMLKLQVRRWSERPRVLVLMLAIMLPAAALIVASAWHLHTLQREKGVEAVIQRDYQHILAIAEKRIDERGYKMTEEIRVKFPDAGQPEDLESFLTAHPNVSHAFIWNGKGHLEWQSQPGMMDDPEFREESKSLSSDIETWLGLESDSYLYKLKKMEAGDGHHALITNEWVHKGDKMQYLSAAYFTPHGSSAEHPALAGFIYDADFMANTFFPQALNQVVPDEGHNDASHPEPAIMVRTAKDQTPLAASACWDGSRPEVERAFDG